MTRFASLTVGDEIVTKELHFTRDSLVRYAGASLDFNPIHYRDDVAAAVGLPGVLAHGMLTMGAAVSPVAEWLAGDGIILDYQTRFTKPVPVDPELGATLTVTGTIAKLDEDSREARVDLQVVCDEHRVLGKTQVLIRFTGDAA